MFHTQEVAKKRGSGGVHYAILSLSCGGLERGRERDTGSLCSTDSYTSVPVLGQQKQYTKT